MFQPDLLRGRRIQVTGGGTGLGRAIGSRFLQLGAALVIRGRRVAVLEGAAAGFQVAHPGGEVGTVGCDPRDPAAADALLGFDDAWWDGMQAC